MTSTDIDSSLNAYLGLPEAYQLGKMEAFKVYSYMLSISGIDREIDAGRLEYYVDKHGDFVNDPKTKRDYIVLAIHKNMSMSDQFETLKYIEYYKETQGFTNFDIDSV